MATITLIVAVLLGIIFAIAQYPFGAIEAVGITIFVGLSVDYALHSAHGYSESHEAVTRRNKVTTMLGHLGISIVGAGLTTAGSCIFLFFCHIFLFVQLGVMLFANALVALTYSLFFLSSTLMIMGPIGKCGDFFHIILCRCVKRKRESKNSAVQVVPRGNAERAVESDFSQYGSTSKKFAESSVMEVSATETVPVEEIKPTEENNVTQGYDV